MNENVCFVVLTYHPKPGAIERFTKILSNVPVIIVDNTPGKKSSRTKGNVTYLHSRKNVGYTGGMNIGIRAALRNGSRWIVLLNDDIGISKTDVKQFVRFLKNAQPSIVGPLPGVLVSRRWTTVYPAPVGRSSADYFSGSCLAIHKTVFDAIGLLYEPYFIYYEDVEFCIKANRAGFPIQSIYLPGLRHTDATTFGAGSPTQEYYLARNHLLFVERNAPLMVKLSELIRLPKTFCEHPKAVIDFCRRRFGGL